MNKKEFIKINEVIDSFLAHNLNPWGDKEALLECNTLDLIKSEDNYEYGKTFYISKDDSTDNFLFLMIHSEFDDVEEYHCKKLADVCNRLSDTFESDIECYS